MDALELRYFDERFAAVLDRLAAIERFVNLGSEIEEAAAKIKAEREKLQAATITNQPPGA